MASSRSGWARCSRPMLGQIGLPGGGYNYALGALGALPGGAATRCPIRRRCRRARTASATSSRSPASPTCCCNPGDDVRLQRPAAAPIPISGWSIGPAATLSITTRTSTGCGGPSAAQTRWSCTRLAWTATARHADIVLPATMTLERDDIGAAPTDPLLVAMQQVRRALRRGARRLRDFRRPGRAAGRRARPSPRAARRANGCAHLYEPTRAGAGAMRPAGAGLRGVLGSAAN